MCGGVTNSEVRKQDVDPASRLEALVSSFEREFATAFILLVSNIKSDLTINQVITLLEAGLVQEAIDRVEASILSFADVVVGATVTSGQSTAAFLQNALNVVVSFDQTNDLAIGPLRETRFRLISGLREAQVEAIRNTLIEGASQGLNPREQARRLRSSIGLTPRQTRAVQAYRSALESNSVSALTRQLRDRRFDSTVRRAASSGEPLTQIQIDRMVNRYVERSVAHRAEVIARTEALSAVHQGNDIMYQQAVSNGVLDPTRVIRDWNTAGDGRVRDTHDGMNGQRRGFGEDFVTDAGVRLRYPGDPQAPAQETVECRCIVTTRLLPIGQVFGVEIV